MRGIQRSATQRKAVEEPFTHIEAEFVRIGSNIRHYGSMDTTPHWLLRRYSDLCWAATLAAAQQEAD